MASTLGTVEFLVDQMAGAGSVSAKRMFGEFGLYCDGKFFAIVADEQLFLKPTASGLALLGQPDEVPPYPGASNWYRIDGERWDERDWLSELARVTVAALPLPKPKKPKS
ncbi:MAG: TfoX/Sxy family protein [Sphingomonadaceae bacterium]